MFTSGRVIGFVIITCGVITILVGVFIGVGLGTIISGIGSMGSGSSIISALSIFSITAGAPLVLEGILVIGFGQLLLLVSSIAQDVYESRVKQADDSH